MNEIEMSKSILGLSNKCNYQTKFGAKIQARVAISKINTVILINIIPVFP